MEPRVTINGVDYELVSREGERNAIVVCDRGFVLYGRISIAGGYVTIRNCQCIRRWGTTRGLGQLAKDGPQADTKLDPQPTTRVHELQVVQIIDCEGEKWKA